MKIRGYLYLLAPLLIFNSCDREAEKEFDNNQDVDMVAASLLVDDFFQNLAKDNTNSGAREADFDESPDYCLTVLQYKSGFNNTSGRLFYDTNNDGAGYYQEVNEQTITAEVYPGQYVFWYAGSGLNQVNEIDFDDEAEKILNDLPFEYEKDQMWYIKVPETDNGTVLKYDIVYQVKGEDTIIRLDPKLKINQ